MVAETSRTFYDVVRTCAEGVHGLIWASRVKTRNLVQQHLPLVIVASEEAYNTNKLYCTIYNTKAYLNLPILHYRGGEEGRGR
jgi:hypothetical protein